jgi:hypothetical protein
MSSSASIRTNHDVRLISKQEQRLDDHGGLTRTCQAWSEMVLLQIIPESKLTQTNWNRSDWIRLAETFMRELICIVLDVFFCAVSSRVNLL